MVTFLRNLRTLHRLARQSRCITPWRNVTGTAVKEETNTELLSAFNQDIKAGGVVPVFRRALLFPSRAALQDDLGVYTYGGLYTAASILSAEIAAQLVGETEKTIAYMCGNDASHVIAQWAIWMTGNIAVPLTPLHPAEMLNHFITDSGACLVICTEEYEKILRPVTLGASKPLLITSRDKEITAQMYLPESGFFKTKPDDDFSYVGKSNSWYGNSDALIIYTSGTTSKPKGVVWTHSMLSYQIASLHCAWQYSANDIVLHTLPLHHIHGQLNSLNASLAAGARVRMLPSFASHAVWSNLLGMGERDEGKVTVFHGVPAMYAKLAAEHEVMFPETKTKEYVRSQLSQRMRLMCVGSAPLPETMAVKWLEISGHRLLERYGMSEAGMALSGPFEPVKGRRAGRVGRPLPGVSAQVAEPTAEGALTMRPAVTVETPVPETQICLHRLGLQTSKDSYVDSKDYEWKESIVTSHALPSTEGYHGELLLKGPGVFTRYWNKAPQLESKDFTKDGWFRTGDIVSYSNNEFQILGRTSVDIIKTNGYKVSALQVESAILEHPCVSDAAVLGIDDRDSGEIVSAVVVLKPNTKLTLKELRDVTGNKLAPYQLPKTLLIVDVMPRNTMGKLDKKEIRKSFAEKLALRKTA